MTAEKEVSEFVSMMIEGIEGATVVSTPLQTWITFPAGTEMPAKNYRLVYPPGGMGEPHVVIYLQQADQQADE